MLTVWDVRLRPPSIRFAPTGSRGPLVLGSLRHARRRLRGRAHPAAPDPPGDRGPRAGASRARGDGAGQAAARGAPGRRARGDRGRPRGGVLPGRGAGPRGLRGPRVRGHLRPLPVPPPHPRGDRPRGRWSRGIERGFDLLYTQEAKLDYAFYVPLHFVDAGAAAADRAPARQRVPATPAYPGPLSRLGPGPRRDPARAPGAHRARRLRRHVPLPGDRPLRLARVRVRPRAARGAGRGPRPRAGRLTGEELDKRGNIELRTWITLLGAVGDVRADVYCYEPSWHHGNAVVEWPL